MAMHTKKYQLEQMAPTGHVVDEEAANRAKPVHDQTDETEPVSDGGCCGRFWNLWGNYFGGDMSAVNRWFRKHHVILQIPNYFLRGLGTPIFLNNPIAGVIILIGMFLGNAWRSVVGIISLLAAILVAIATKQDLGLIESGILTFHALLVGLVAPIFVFKPDWYWWLLLPVVVLAAISVFVASGLGNIFGKLDLIPFNLPFNICTFLLVASWGADNPFFPAGVYDPRNEDNSTNSSAVIQWDKIGWSILVNIGQVYGYESALTGGLILIACLVAAPITALHVILGSVISTISALSFAANLDSIYAGLYGYNGILTCSVLGGYLWVFSVDSCIYACIGAIFSTYLFATLANILYAVNLPALAFPYALSSIVFLGLTSGRGTFVRVPIDQITYPEQHVFMNRKGKYVKTS
ncbi:urea transporter 2-like [Tubulanus polymorphus]|uniref:urea transporter 2-like n=1 Tax=Tubulanus polymorphus TaxID=672921 RepID=UPI003DA39C20